MVQRLQQAIDTFIERFQTRWETQSSFRATWSTLGVAVIILIMLSCAIIGTNALSGLLGSGGSTTKARISIGGVAVNGTNYPLASLTPLGTSLTAVGATPVATVSAVVTPTPTATPNDATPSPTPSASPSVTVTVTGTPGPPTIAAIQSPNPWQATQPGYLGQITTTPAQANQTLQITLAFGTSGCVTFPNPITVQLDGNGQHQGNVSFTVPNCFPAGNATVTATYTINGMTFTDTQNTFAAHK
jgi:hypothetical protein